MTEENLATLEETIRVSLKPSRWQHTLRCQKTAVQLARHHGLCIDTVSLAALCHDAYRDLSSSQLLGLAEAWKIPVSPQERSAPVLLHGPLAACYFEKTWKIHQMNVIQAIRYHTSGHTSLDPIGQILFLADGIEPGKNYPGRVELEEMAYQNLELACLSMLQSNLIYLEKNGLVCHPASQQWLDNLVKKRKSGV